MKQKQNNDKNCTCHQCVAYRKGNPHKYGVPEWKKNLIVIAVISIIFGVVAGIAQYQQTANVISGLFWGFVIYALSFVGWYAVKLIAFR